jgi:branched-chain amino acid transport system substrate-binding protein
MSKKFFFVIGLLLLVILSIVFWTRFIKKDTSFRFGAVLPLSGDIAEYGKRCKAGMDLAVEKVNGSGGINGREVSIIYEDTRGNAKDGVSALNKLVSVDDVKYVVGDVASSVTLAIEPIATRNKVILFSPAASSPKLTGISPFFFRDWPSDLFEATVLAEFVHKELKFKNVAILYVNNDYGLGLRDEFKRHFEELGGSISVSDAYEQGANDFRAQLAKIKDAAPEAVYLAGYHREMAQATKQMRELGITVQILGDADYGVEELLEISGSASEAAIYSIPEYEPQRGSQTEKDFAASFYSAHKSNPTIFEPMDMML